MPGSNGRYEAIKALILAAAAEQPDIGPLVETVKWGQPSFAPQKAGIGSSVRIELRRTGDAALMFICTSGVVDELRTLYDGELQFEGNRALVLPGGDVTNAEAIKHCIQLALTTKLRRR